MVREVLTLEEMQELISNGLDPKNASLYKGKKYGHYIDAETYKNHSYNEKLDDEFEPVFTLSDIIDKLPCAIYVDDKYYSIKIEIPTSGNITVNDIDGELYASFWGEGGSWINAGFKCLLWCLKNKHITK